MTTPSEVTEPRPAAQEPEAAPERPPAPPALPSISAAEAAAAYAAGVRASAPGAEGAAADGRQEEPSGVEVEQRATPRRGFLRTLAASVGARFRSASAPAASGAPSTAAVSAEPANTTSEDAEAANTTTSAEAPADESVVTDVEPGAPEPESETPVGEDVTQDAGPLGAEAASADESAEPSVAAAPEEAEASPDPEPADPVVPDSVATAPVVEETEDSAAPEPDAEPVVPADEPAAEARPVVATGDVIRVSGLTKSFGELVAVDGISLDIPAGSFYGIVGPNGAGKTTTLSMITGLLRPDAGTVHVNGIDVWADPAAAKRTIGVLPDRMRLFDRLTGAQLLYYAGVLRGLDNVTVRSRVKSLTRAFGLEDAVGRLVADYSVGMAKKISLAAALIHSPRVLVLDEPFESVDPVSSASITGILQKYVENGGTVVFSSHGMEFIERVCDHVAIIVGGTVLAEGTVDAVRGKSTLEKTFVRLAGGRKATEDLEWLHSFSD